MDNKLLYCQLHVQLASRRPQFAHATVVFHLGKAACNSCLCNQLANSIMIEFTSQNTTWHWWANQSMPKQTVWACEPTIAQFLTFELWSIHLYTTTCCPMLLWYLFILPTQQEARSDGEVSSASRSATPTHTSLTQKSHLPKFSKPLHPGKLQTYCKLQTYQWLVQQENTRALKSWHHHLRVMGDVTLYLKTGLTSTQMTLSCGTPCFIFYIWWYLPILLMPGNWRLAQLPTSDSPCFAVPTCSNFPWLSPKKPQVWADRYKIVFEIWEWRVFGHRPWVNGYQRDRKHWSYLCT